MFWEKLHAGGCSHPTLLRFLGRPDTVRWGWGAPAAGPRQPHCAALRRAAPRRNHGQPAGCRAAGAQVSAVLPSPPAACAVRPAADGRRPSPCSPAAQPQGARQELAAAHGGAALRPARLVHRPLRHRGALHHRLLLPRGQGRHARGGLWQAARELRWLGGAGRSGPAHLQGRPGVRFRGRAAAAAAQGRGLPALALASPLQSSQERAGACCPGSQRGAHAPASRAPLTCARLAPARRLQAFDLDVRPALDSFDSALDRVKMSIYEQFARWGLPCPITGHSGGVVQQQQQQQGGGSGGAQTSATG
jgi:hypothetical protein